jgi:integrase
MSALREASMKFTMAAVAIEDGRERRFKGPKRERHKRTIQIDAALVQLLLTVREKHQRLIAGVPDNAVVDMSLIKLPDGALMFPSFFRKEFDLCAPRDARALSKLFERAARKVHPGICFHDLRGSHEKALLDAGVPVHVVAARCGHDPAVLLYAKRTNKADTSAAAVIAAMSKGVL